jgi:hypothetical protein
MEVFRIARKEPSAAKKRELVPGRLTSALSKRKRAALLLLVSSAQLADTVDIFPWKTQALRKIM